MLVAYGKSELDYGKSHLHRLADAAEVAHSLSSPIGDSIPETPLRPLKQLSEEARITLVC